MKANVGMADKAIRLLGAIILIIFFYKGLIHEFRIIGLAHIAFLGECAVERQRYIKIVDDVTASREFEVLAQQRTVNRIGCMFDYFLGTLHRVLETQVGNTLVGNDDVDRVNGVVNVSNHRYDGADAVVFLD